MLSDLLAEAERRFSLAEYDWLVSMESASDALTLSDADCPLALAEADLLRTLAEVDSDALPFSLAESDRDPLINQDWLSLAEVLLELETLPLSARDLLIYSAMEINSLTLADLLYALANVAVTWPRSSPFLSQTVG
ncbi:MAG: hypothetical protein MR607_08955 [Lachnospiraceae bacterium]|nr:hypothetical protein [Lachnospiraceae bacterium]